MRILVVGAGASYAEALELKLPKDLQPPLMWNFASRLWAEYNPHDLMSLYLASLGYDGGQDARARFLELEAQPNSKVHIERFFAFAYSHRNLILPGREIYDPASEYDNLLLHGILNPLTCLLVEGLLRPSPDGCVDLPLTRRVASRLRAGDLVVNLNYDTVFETGAELSGHDLVFVPNTPRADSLTVAKPHGSLNLFVDPAKGAFWFAKPYFAGGLQPSDGSRNYLGFVPPRFGKTYEQHPIAEVIFDAIRHLEPWVVTFWGIGLTDSDTDLLELFRAWARRAAIEVINPDSVAAMRFSTLLGQPVAQFASVSDWEEGRSAWTARLSAN